MTDIKISELTNLAAVPEDTDEMVINDDTTTKAIAAAYVRRWNPPVTISSSGAQSTPTTSKTHIKLNHGSAIALTLTGAPVAGDELFIIAETSATHTVTLSGSVKWNASNHTIATFNAVGETLHCVAYSATRWDIVANNGVVLS